MKSRTLIYNDILMNTGRSGSRYGLPPKGDRFKVSPVVVAMIRSFTFSREVWGSAGGALAGGAKRLKGCNRKVLVGVNYRRSWPNLLHRTE